MGGGGVPVFSSRDIVLQVIPLSPSALRTYIASLLRVFFGISVLAAIEGGSMSQSVVAVPCLSFFQQTSALD